MTRVTSSPRQFRPFQVCGGWVLDDLDNETGATYRMVSRSLHLPPQHQPLERCLHVPLPYHFHRAEGADGYHCVDYHASEKDKRTAQQNVDLRLTGTQTLYDHEEAMRLQAVRLRGAPMHMCNRADHPTLDTNKPFRFLDLPAELRMHIYSLPIQSGCVFSVAPCLNPGSRVYGKRAQNRVAITKIKPLNCGVFHDNVSSLFCVSRQLRDECYPILYGGNAFIFRQEPENVLRTKFESVAFDRCQLWTKIFPSSKSSLWPLNERTVAYAKELTLVVTFMNNNLRLHTSSFRVNYKTW